MVFKCQEDSFLKEFTSKVVSCEKVKININVDGKSQVFEGYAVVLENTILFPEGGGQPSDTGYLNESRVYYVARKEDIAVHYVDKPLNIGEDAKQVIDWQRREDHMKQHSGQHLISAILEREHQIPTVSWWLGIEVSYIELDTPSVNDHLLKDVEKRVNLLIQEGREVTVVLFDKNSPSELLDDARSARGLPEDHKGDIRVINIEGIDTNMCCGTHVTNLRQLQAIKFLQVEKSKRKDKTLLYFLCGDRVLQKLELCLKREQKLTQLLKSNPAQHVELVEKLQNNVKVFSKNLNTILKELAVLEATKLKKVDPSPQYYSLHRKEAESDFMNIFIQELGKQDIFLFLSTGDDKGAGNIVLYGPASNVQILGPKICEILNGKGAGKGNKFQAKVTKMSNRCKAEQLILDHLNIDKEIEV